MEVIPATYPDGFYPLKVLGKQLSYEVARLKSICKALKIDVTSIDGITYIPSEAKSILERAVADKKAGRQIDYSTSSTTKPISVSKVKTAPPQAAEAPALVVSRAGGAGASPEQFFASLAALLEQQQASSPPPSPLQAQRELKEAADSGFVITSEQVANILGMKKSTISSWKDGSKRLGFRFIKVKESNTTLWKVEQY